MNAMPSPALAAAVLGALALLACARLLWWQRRAVPDMRARPWRLALLLAAQPAWAALLCLALHPPARTVSPEVLVVLAAGSSADQARGAEGIAVALPEAPALPAARRVPDLGTALRLYPQVGTIRVVGNGLPARDRDALAGRRLHFESPPAAPGLAALAWPSAPVAGDALHVSGRAEAVPDGRVELLDPAGVRVDAAALDADGGFRLDAPVFAAGPAAFRLRLLGADGAQVEDAALPVFAQAAPPPRLQLLAGAPNAETRFLRRWATDAGLPLRARVALGGGMALGDAAAAPGAQSLAQTDALLVDARAWGGLGAGGRAAVLAAVEAGMGLIVRADAPPAALPGLWTPGFRAEGGAGTVALAWPKARLADAAALRARLGAGSADAPFDQEAAQAPPP
ncbi:carboxypeptidase regulatory-like domain-containing protein, partial [Luteimonas sp. Y-2-2-4F]|nr:carboxypeptidase regulatory-like domain-containing protein [Luteimonas sp. Y-2-2-4F]